MINGRTEWFIPDGFMSSTANGKLVSHEAICVLNTSNEDAEIAFEIYFEDREPLKGFCAHCPARRAVHVRLDQITNTDGIAIPKDTPYGVFVKTSVPIALQYSRMDVSQAEMALMTSVPYGV